MKQKITYLIITFLFFTIFTSTSKAADLKTICYSRIPDFQKDTTTTPCVESECRLYVHVAKSEQRMYLYIDGVATDTFKVSTGKKNHPTPDINMRPNGPTYTKYSSDYKGLGNMPYVVFIKGGYGIHGTTPGNFLRLGHRASHGCIRLHPDDAKYFYGLVQQYGLENTWVKVSEN
jgi:lipoprotein-anchoring transpeptidase ErfK/SrfK